MPAKKSTKKTEKKLVTENNGSTVSLVVNTTKPKAFLLNFLSSRTTYFILFLLLIALLVYLASRYLVVAWVDKQPITRFEYYADLDKKFGNELKDQLIVEKLIFSEAAKRKISITPEEISAEIKKIEGEQGGGEQLKKILEMQGITQQELNRLVKLQLLRQKMFGDNINITDEDLNKYLEENKEQFTSQPTEEQKVQIKEQLKNQKLSTDFNNWVKENINGDRVIRL